MSSWLKIICGTIEAHASHVTLPLICPVQQGGMFNISVCFHAIIYPIIMLVYIVFAYVCT